MRILLPDGGYRLGRAVVARRAPAEVPAQLRAISAALVAVGVVGAGYGFAIALRADAVGRHPISAAFGTSAPVTVTPSETALSLGPAD
ncbi:hypothetical protein BZL29_1781 [Mycobacterium kansasii]|uniref:Uncharacterized protein n=1 Tax=Mycobacterium kansasii TaxID=1768 RepID=A0A1V3XRA2_MYCKA|nr:hypothetical protein BZL29_1781 [Mycobacterium kansasii]